MFCRYTSEKKKYQKAALGLQDSDEDDHEQVAQGFKDDVDDCHNTSMTNFWCVGDWRPDWKSALGKEDSESYGRNIHVSCGLPHAWI